MAPSKANKRKSSAKSLSANKKARKDGLKANSKNQPSNPNKAAKDKQKKLTKEKERRKADARLQTVRSLVEEQPTDAFQSMLFSFAEKNLGLISKNEKKALGVAKFGGDADFIPGSLDFEPKLDVHSSLVTDTASTEELETWKVEVVNCKKALAKIIHRQAERNRIAMCVDHQKTVLKKC